MSTENDISSRLRGEFAAMPEPPARPTAQIVAAGRRRQRGRMAFAGAATLAVIAAAAVAVPATLRAMPQPDNTPAATAQQITWTQCRVPTTTQPPPDDRRWLGWLTDAEFKAAVEGELRKVAPGARLESGDVGRKCPYIESGAEISLSVTRADGVKGVVTVVIDGELGDPVARADDLVTTGERKHGGGPSNVDPSVQRERRSIGDGIEAVVYPQGAEMWTLPVDVFTARNTAIVVAASAQGGADEPLTPAESVLSIDQMIAVAQGIAALRPEAPPTGPARVVNSCDDTPPADLPQVTTDRVKQVLTAELARIVPGAVPVWRTASACWSSESERALRGSPPGSGHLFVSAGFTGNGKKGEVSISIAIRDGDPQARATEVLRTGDWFGAGFQAPLTVPANRPHEQRSLGDGVHGVLYPQGAGFRELPVRVFAPELNIGVSAAPPIPEGPSGVGDPGPEDVTPDLSPLTNDQLLQIGKALAEAF